MPPIAAWQNHLRPGMIDSMGMSHCPMGLFHYSIG
jgi:hypothetical protein